MNEWTHGVKSCLQSRRCFRGTHPKHLFTERVLVRVLTFQYSPIPQKFHCSTNTTLTKLSYTCIYNWYWCRGIGMHFASTIPISDTGIDIVHPWSCCSLRKILCKYQMLFLLRNKQNHACVYACACAHVFVSLCKGRPLKRSRWAWMEQWCCCWYLAHVRISARWRLMGGGTERRKQLMESSLRRSGQSSCTAGTFSSALL